MQNGNGLQLGEILLRSGVVTHDQLDLAIETQKQSDNLKLGEALLELGFVTELQVAKALEIQFRIPLLNLAETEIDKDAVTVINEALARKHVLIPVRLENEVLTVAISDPLNFYATDDIRRATGLNIRTVISTKGEILGAIDRMYGNESAERAAEDLSQEYELVDFEGLAQITENEVANAPVVRLVNSIIQHAAKAGASDIHFEPMENALRIRFRIDGKLQEVMRPTKSAHPAIVTRIKIMCNLDISEKRIPQDGRVNTEIDGRKIDLRISVLPTAYGEKIVIRLLGLGNTTYSIDKLGLSETNRTMFDKIIKSANGIILVSGPTGSGKTTTLYSALMDLNKVETNIITVEDPVEFKMDGVNQVQVNTRAGLTFATGLRSILRQDPDIIMIGEIRDAETAQIAMRAAITGHLVLSTIHTNDAPSSIARLIDMGIEPFLAASSLVGVIAQRLVRKLCPRCKQAFRTESSDMSILRLTEPREIYRAVGCHACNNSGYAGRKAIHEVLPIGREIKELIEAKATTEQIRQAAFKLGTTSLSDNASKLVLDGTTTIEELIAVTYTLE